MQESFPRDNLLTMSKILAEAKPSKRKAILGWVVDTRRFRVKLPREKREAWTDAIVAVMKRHTYPVSTKWLETTLGRLSHAAHVIPLARHFMGRL